jgi:hypothetical protein
MYHQLCYQSALIIVLLTLYCYASPIDQNQQSEILEQIISKFGKRAFTSAFSGLPKFG